jgi:hypothetical protein
MSTCLLGSPLPRYVPLILLYLTLPLLVLGFSQMMRMIPPPQVMTLHLSQIGFTLVRTFISLPPKVNAAF